mmetsp:Transcript_20486/g.29324  ORF Transcript_20486/g.29324 Transcript_20486/m.29324 type:complete len:415 (-) Transcript_20486:132-1376(-)
MNDSTLSNFVDSKHGQEAPDREDATKKLAQQGQWRTPPLPVFTASANIPLQDASADGGASSALPTSADEYALMLQEAYKRGQQAGALSSHPTSESDAAAVPSVSTRTAVHVTNYAAAVPAAVSSNADVVAPPTNNNYAVGGSLNTSSRAVTHSKSMPDMSSYQNTLANANDEEEKRKKRLARNRASARLRRLKKKNLVDSYEGEVGVLEASLTKLRAHQWGAADSNNHEALIEALSMERGQQPLTAEKRRELISSIVSQQREQVANLLDCQLESWILSELANAQSSDSNTMQQNDPELDELTSELQSVLSLSPEQLSRIQKSSKGSSCEIKDLYAIDDCLKSIQDNNWLLDEGVDEISSQFTSILNPAQLSKFLLWSDHNADAIEKLDYVNVGASVENGPVFEFGIDEGYADGE